MVLRGHSAAEAAAALAASLADGTALASWTAMVEAHGGDPDPDRLPRPSRTIEVVSDRAGVVSGIAAADLGRVAAAVGAGRRRRDEGLAFGAGVTVHARLGDRVERGQPLATLEIGDRPVDIDDTTRRIGAAFELTEGSVKPPALVLGTVDEVDPRAHPAG
jgi:thymidine phosphorylase